MLVKVLYAVVLILALVAGWKLWGVQEAYHYFENGMTAQSYGAAPEDTKMTIIAVMDYSSPSSRDINATLMQAVASTPGARVIFVPMPQPGAVPLRVAKMAMASAGQGKFMALHEEFMRNNRPFTDDVMRELAARVGVDFDRLKADAEKNETAYTLRKAVESAAYLGVTHTPTIIFNRRTAFVPERTLTSTTEFLQLIEDSRS